MKRLLGFLIVAALAACTCLSQIPDQLVYVDQNCEANLPDYTPDVVVVDNCDNATITQSPPAGTLLDSGQPVTVVTVTATDISNNTASITFNVMLVDTIAPTIQAGGGLLSYNAANIGKIIQIMHKGVIAMHDSLIVNYPEYNHDTTYRQDNLMIVSNLNANHMPMSFVNPEHMILVADSAYMADSCGLTWQTLRIQFTEP